MSILIDEMTRVLVQGLTGLEGAFHAGQMIAYGSKVVAGVTPGKGGTLQNEIPVFNTVAEAVRVRQRRQHTLDDVPRRAVWHAHACRLAEPKDARERDPRHVLEHERREPRLLEERPHLDDARMPQAHAHRGLASEGETFSNIVESVRRELAARYVEDPRRTLSDLSGLLGFAAPSGFTRWYRRQFGESPSRRRRSADR